MKRKVLFVLFVTVVMILLAQSPSVVGEFACPTPTPTIAPTRPTSAPFTPTITYTATLIPLSTPTLSVTPTPTVTPAPEWTYWVRIEKATTEYVVLQCRAQPNHKEYSVYLNVCEETEGCEWWPPIAVQVLDEGWWTEPVTIYWEDIGKSANAGDTARIWWDCTVRPPGGGLVIFFDTVDRAITGQVSLPVVAKNYEGG